MSKNRGQTQSRRERRKADERRDFNNKKGIQMVITYYGGFVKVIKYFQRFKGKTIVHYR